MRKLHFFIIIFLSITAGNAVFSETPLFLDIYKTDHVWYGVTGEQGLFVSTNNGRQWVERNDNLPHKVVYPFNMEKYREITSFSYDPENIDRIVLTNSYGIFVSENQGINWMEISLGGVLKYSNYITSAALSPFDKNIIIVGTSFNSVFITNDLGKTWKSISSGMSIIYRGAGFYEEITSIACNPEKEGEFVILCGFEKGVYRYNPEDKKIYPIEFSYAAAERIVYNKLSSGWGIEVKTRDSVYRYNGDSWLLTKSLFPDNSFNSDSGRLSRLETAADKYGIYVNSHNGSGEDLVKQLNFIKTQGFNSIVIDLKDDEGIITYNTSLSIPYQAGAVRKRIDIEALVKAAHDLDIYIIGRIVVFKDEKLYKLNNNVYAVWNNTVDKPWGRLFRIENEETEAVTYLQKEFWVDTFSEDIWNYNISIAEEIQSFGVDEIQFDYIRFPTDGDLSTASYRFQKSGMSRMDALESFLILAREKINIPISTDLYGFNSWYRMGNWNGQNIEMVSNYVDVISPMFYPSHFPAAFLKELEYLDRAERIYNEGTKRALLITEGKSLIRPYVQAFLLPAEYYMEKEEYTDYLIRQLSGACDADSSGYTLWNASNIYYMITKSLADYIN